jgi:diacylglycerol kinase (ATP)
MMKESPAFGVIVNPAANKGGAASRWAQIRTELTARLGAFEPRFTKAPGHATELARGALAEGARRIVAVGGDGTVNEALNGLLDGAGRLVVPDAVLCPIPAGTANELCRALGHLEHPMRAYEAAAGAGTRPSIFYTCVARASMAGQSSASAISSCRWEGPPPSAIAPRSHAG